MYRNWSPHYGSSLNLPNIPHTQKKTLFLHIYVNLVINKDFNCRFQNGQEPNQSKQLITWLGGGFKYFLFSPLFGEESHFDSYFSKGLKPPTRAHHLRIEDVSYRAALKSLQKQFYRGELTIFLLERGGGATGQKHPTKTYKDKKQTCLYINL